MLGLPFIKRRRLPERVIGRLFEDLSVDTSRANKWLHAQYGERAILLRQGDEISAEVQGRQRRARDERSNQQDLAEGRVVESSPSRGLTVR